MKRQRTQSQSEPATPPTSYNDVLKFLHLDRSMNCQQLLTLQKEITRLYATQANLVVQNFPHDMWTQIFAKIGTKYGEKNLPLCLSWRTVCQSWNWSIAKMDCSNWVRFHDRPNLSQILKLKYSLNFSAFRLKTHHACIEPRFLTDVKTLDIPADWWGGSWCRHSLWGPQLTQLTKLCLRGSLHDEELNALTNLQNLKLISATEVSTLSSLTNLRRLKSLGQNKLTPRSLEPLTQLEYLETDQPEQLLWAGKGTCPYPSGKYTGEWLNGQKSGYGVSNFGRTKYEGQWLNNHQHGHGVAHYWNPKLETSEKSWYTGNWARGKRSGKGKRHYSNGETYEGDWTSGFKTGRGVYKFNDGSVYDGDWLKGSITGQGKCIYGNGDTYEGQWLFGERHGHGVYVFAHNGLVVEGHWYVNLFAGEKTSYTGLVQYLKEFRGECYVPLVYCDSSSEED